MTQRENIIRAIDHLEKAIDTFPDKDDEIRKYNDDLWDIIDELKVLITK